MRVHGYKGQVKLDPAGGTGTSAVAVASLNAWSLDMARDKVDVTAFGDVNKQYVQGLMDLKGTIGGWWDSAASGPIFDAAEGDTPVWLDLIPTTLEPTFLWSGLAYLDASINVSSTGAVSISSNFVAAGPWAREPVTPLASRVAA
jgi:hypothetical protein